MLGFAGCSLTEGKCSGWKPRPVSLSVIFSSESIKNKTRTSYECRGTKKNRKVERAVCGWNIGWFWKDAGLPQNWRKTRGRDKGMKTLFKTTTKKKYFFKLFITLLMWKMEDITRAIVWSKAFRTDSDIRTGRVSSSGNVYHLHSGGPLLESRTGHKIGFSLSESP